MVTIGKYILENEDDESLKDFSVYVIDQSLYEDTAGFMNSLKYIADSNRAKVYVVYKDWDEDEDYSLMVDNLHTAKPSALKGKKVLYIPKGPVRNKTELANVVEWLQDMAKSVAYEEALKRMVDAHGKVRQRSVKHRRK